MARPTYSNVIFNLEEGALSPRYVREKIFEVASSEHFNHLLMVVRAADMDSGHFEVQSGSSCDLATSKMKEILGRLDAMGRVAMITRETNKFSE